MHALGDQFDNNSLKTHAWQYIMHTKPEYAIAPAMTLNAGQQRQQQQPMKPKTPQASPPAPPPPPPSAAAYDFMGPPPGEAVALAGNPALGRAPAAPAQQRQRPPKAADVVGEWKKRLQGSWAQCQPTATPTLQRPPPPQGKGVAMGKGIGRGPPPPMGKGGLPRGAPAPRGMPRGQAAPPPPPPPTMPL